MSVELSPGEFSLHHVDLLHGGGPNESVIDRIGIAYCYWRGTVIADPEEFVTEVLTALTENDPSFGAYSHPSAGDVGGVDI